MFCSISSVKQWVLSLWTKQFPSKLLSRIYIYCNILKWLLSVLFCISFSVENVSYSCCLAGSFIHFCAYFEFKQLHQLFLNIHSFIHHSPIHDLQFNCNVLQYLACNFSVLLKSCFEINFMNFQNPTKLKNHSNTTLWFTLVVLNITTICTHYTLSLTHTHW